MKDSIIDLIIFIPIILLLIFVSVFIIYFYPLLSPDIGFNTIEFGPKRISDIYIKFQCQSDADFFVENSNILCKAQVLSRSRINRDVDIQFHAFDIEDTSNHVWECHVSFDEVTNISYVEYKICENIVYNNTLPKISRTIKLRITSLIARSNEVGIDYNNEEDIYFDKSLEIISIKEWLNFQTQKQLLSYTGILIYITLIAIIASIATINYQTREQIKIKKRFDKGIQKDLLHGLEIQIKMISQNIIGHKKELNKKPPVIPSYFINDIDSSFYATQLKSNFNNKETKTLKEKLIKAHNKIKNINRLLELGQNAEASLNKQVKDQIIKEIKSKNFKYHNHLTNLIKEISSEIDKLNVK